MSIFRAVLISISIFAWGCANGYFDEITTVTPVDQSKAYGNIIEFEGVSVALAHLLNELDQPRPIMTMTKRPLTEPDDVDCPLTLCNHVKGVVLVPNRPRFFVSCLPQNQFCGLCPSGTIVTADDHSFQCIPSLDVTNTDNETEACQLDPSCLSGLWPRLLLSVVNETEVEKFIVCSKKRSFCGFCQADVSNFNQNMLTCDLRFPETTFRCPLVYSINPDSNGLGVYPDPLRPCSPLAYICVPMKRRGISFRCPNPKTRYSHSLRGCDLPERIPECGGVVQSNANETLIELPLNSTQQVIRSPATNCVFRCMYGWGKPKNFCIRICTN